MQYGLIERLAYPQNVNSCSGDSKFMYVQLDTEEAKSALGICRLTRKMAADPLLALAAIVWLLGIA